MPRSTLSVVCYALPALALAALYLPLFTYVTPFYVAERGVDLAALGAAWIAIRLFDAVSDPAMGWLSDRTRSRWGRRRIWIVTAVPLITIACWQAFVPPADAGLGHAVFWLFALTIGWTMAQTPYAAWGAEVAEGYDDRARITGWREAMVLVGTLATTVLYFAGGEGGEGLALIAAVIAVLLPLAVLVAVTAMGEAQEVSERRLDLREGWRTLSGNLLFRRLLIAFFINGAANALPASLLLFFVEYRLGAPEALAWLVPLYFVCAVAGVPFWTWAARRWSKHRAWGVAMLYACAVFTGALFLGEGDVAGFGVVVVLTGLALGADMSLPPAIQADVIERDRQQTGAARAGMFFAIWQVATKAALAISSGLGFIALGWAGFRTLPDNSPEALMTLSLLYAGVPVLLKLVAVSLMWRFPLDRAAMETPA
ncbi:MFS transporter [Rhodobacteraceae bacterium NNCM2]|nr:MFS transporter [Coraliihabitans acroporae]